MFSMWEKVYVFLRLLLDYINFRILFEDIVKYLMCEKRYYSVCIVFEVLWINIWYKKCIF